MRRASLIRYASLCAVAHLACQSKPPLAPPVPGLVAALEKADEIIVVRRINEEWVPEKHLPKAARALRFSPDGATVTWVQDEQGDGGVRPLGYVQRWGAEKPELLGALGLRTRAAMGLSPGRDGQAAWLDEAGELKLAGGTLASLGRGSDPLSNGKGDWAFLNQARCLETTSGLVPPDKLCMGAMRPLQFIDGVLLARDNGGLWKVTKDAITRVPMGEVVHAELRKQDTMVVRRVSEQGRVAEAVFLVRPTEQIREVTRGAVIISASYDADGSILVIRAPGRRDLYELMLAHAPEEFGGEALAGHAYRYSATHLKEAEVPGLELERVRALFRAR